MKYKALLLLALSFLTSQSYALPPGIKYIEKPWKAPEIGLTDIDGRKHTLKNYQGNILIINFWGTWCQPCRKEMPALQRAYRQLKKENISIIAIAMGDTSSDVMQYRNNNPVDFALISDKDSMVSTNWSIPALPTSYILNQSGEVIIRVIGEYEWDNPHFLKEIIALKSKN
ncbi:MAG: redoxin domain-containing protein [Gammaproteobacteria bacterium]|nr:redoxin domain-containing protein [Gammaproteobacteria bacterium]